MKRFFAHVMSESCDHYYIQFEAEKEPREAGEWLPILWEHVPHECPEPEDEPGCGIAGTWLHIKHCEEITI